MIAKKFMNARGGARTLNLEISNPRQVVKVSRASQLCHPGLNEFLSLTLNINPSSVKLPEQIPCGALSLSVLLSLSSGPRYASNFLTGLGGTTVEHIY